MEELEDKLWGINKDKKVIIHPDIYEGNKKNTNFEPNKRVVFDRDSFITLGNGDGEMERSKKRSKFKRICCPELSSFMNKMQFLVYFCDPYYTPNVYIIEPVCTEHLALLAKLFDNFKFIVYSQKVVPSFDNLIIKRQKFDYQEAEEIDGKNSLIIFDSFDDSMEKAEIMPHLVEQRALIEKIKPCLAMVNFVLYEENKNYLDGIILRSVFNQANSYIKPLIITAIAYRDWDIKNYHRKINFHEDNVRVYSTFNHPLINRDDDYDTTALVMSVVDYLIKINKYRTVKNINTTVEFILKNCYFKKEIDLKIKKLTC